MKETCGVPILLGIISPIFLLGMILHFPWHLLGSFSSRYVFPNQGSIVGARKLHPPRPITPHLEPPVKRWRPKFKGTWQELRSHGNFYTHLNTTYTLCILFYIVILWFIVIYSVIKKSHLKTNSFFFWGGGAHSPLKNPWILIKKSHSTAISSSLAFHGASKALVIFQWEAASWNRPGRTPCDPLPRGRGKLEHVEKPAKNFGKRDVFREVAGNVW